jgi:hypothetical protein
MVCVFITAGPSTKLFAWGGGDIGGHVLRETTKWGPFKKTFSPWAKPISALNLTRFSEGFLNFYATLQFRVQFPNERNQGKQGAPLC